LEEDEELLVQASAGKERRREMDGARERTDVQALCMHTLREEETPVKRTSMKGEEPRRA
jgi:hypothetical protein